MRILSSFMAVALSALTGWSGEWKLVWSDEFDRDGLPDPAKWAYEEGFVRNQELQENDGTGMDSWPFDAPQYLILNLAIGGMWGGQKGIDDAIFPQRLAIDYVRVYQRPGAGG